MVQLWTPSPLHFICSVTTLWATSVVVVQLWTPSPLHFICSVTTLWATSVVVVQLWTPSPLHFICSVTTLWATSVVVVQLWTPSPLHFICSVVVVQLSPLHFICSVVVVQLSPLHFICSVVVVQLSPFTLHLQCYNLVSCSGNFAWSANYGKQVYISLSLMWLSHLRFIASFTIIITVHCTHHPQLAPSGIQCIFGATVNQMSIALW